MTTDRAEYTAGLRALADLLDANPHLTLTSGSHQYDPLLVMPYGPDQREECAAWVRAIPGTVTKTEGAPGYLRLSGQLRGLHIRVLADRDQVCTRVVTGSEEVTRLVPDPAVEVPMVEVAETVETVIWECEPLLAERVSA